MDEKEKKEKEKEKEIQTTIQIFGLFAFVWTMFGLIAFVWSIYCFGKTGTIFQKIVGIILAMFLGPLFFFFYRYSPTYCK
jgi:hypothetical protein